MNVALRRIDSGRRNGAYHVTLDKLDVSGLFVRYTIDVEQDASGRAAAIALDDDPFATLAEQRLGDEEVCAYGVARRRFGYRVVKDRKFVVPADRVEAMRCGCEARGTHNIIYGI